MLCFPTSEPLVDSQQASLDKCANTVSSTPSKGCSSMPGYVSSYGYANSSVVPSTPFTQKPGAMQSSVALPTFRLSNSLPLDQISCSINAATLPSAIIQSESTYPPVSDEMGLSKPYEKEAENLWLGNCGYKEYNDDGASNLFISWNGKKSELLEKLQHYTLEVRIVFRCSDDGIFNVVFENHLSARKAFLMQRKMRLRMVPPKGSHRNWFRYPSPDFLVKYETRRRLVVKKQKAVVGVFLMSNRLKQKGCIL